MVGLNDKQQLKQMANTFLTHRRMGEAEAIYRIMADMHLSESNVKCVFVTTGWPEARSVHANKVSSDPNDPKYIEDPLAYEIEGREGLYREAPTLMSKYERRGNENNLDKLSYAQFCKERI